MKQTGFTKPLGEKYAPPSKGRRRRQLRSVPLRTDYDSDDALDLFGCKGEKGREGAQNQFQTRLTATSPPADTPTFPLAAKH